MTAYEHEDRGCGELTAVGGRVRGGLGYNTSGQLGNGTTSGQFTTTPEQIGTATNWTSLPRIGSSNDSLALASG